MDKLIYLEDGCFFIYLIKRMFIEGCATPVFLAVILYKFLAILLLVIFAFFMFMAFQTLGVSLDKVSADVVAVAAALTDPASNTLLV